jgi:hypothetical protein
VLRKQRYAGHPVEGDWLERFPAAYVLEMQRWTENLRDGRLTGPDAWDDYASLLAVESCIASVHSGSKEPFKIPRSRNCTGEAPAGVRTRTGAGVTCPLAGLAATQEDNLLARAGAVDEAGGFARHELSPAGEKVRPKP